MHRKCFLCVAAILLCCSIAGAQPTDFALRNALFAQDMFYVPQYAPGMGEQDASVPHTLDLFGNHVPTQVLFYALYQLGAPGEKSAVAMERAAGELIYVGSYTKINAAAYEAATWLALICWPYSLASSLPAF